MDKSRDFVTGLLFFGVLGLLGVFTILLSGFRFGPQPKLTVAFMDVSGLETGHEVRVDGFRSGKVWEIDIRPEEGVILVTSVFNEKPAIYEGAEFWVTAASPLGGRVLEIRNPPREERKKRMDLSKIQARLGELVSELDRTTDEAEAERIRARIGEVLVKGRAQADVLSAAERQSREVPPPRQPPAVPSGPAKGAPAGPSS